MPLDGRLYTTAAIPGRDHLAALLRRPGSSHPKLMVRAAALDDLRRSVAADNRTERFLERCHAAAPKQGQLADTRSALKRRGRCLIGLAFMALMDGPEARDALMAARAMLGALASAPDWNHRPVIGSFLDCAETAVAVALAYDWLHDRLSPAERNSIEDALLRHILEPACAVFAGPGDGWPRRHENVTLVSNAAITLAALAVGGRVPEIAAEALHGGLCSAWAALAAFGPDGAWHEGPSYWSLTVRYLGLMITALETCLGDSFGLAGRPGLAATGDFALHAAGPSGSAFNFGDSVCAFDRMPLAWLAHRFGAGTGPWCPETYKGWHLPLVWLWSQPRARPVRAVAAEHAPTGKIFRGAGLACFRNSWANTPGAQPVFFAIKGGNDGSGLEPSDAPPALHAQCDAGTFVVDGARCRWALDLGGDSYDLPGYFDPGGDGGTGQRWRYYRTSRAGHNTLQIEGAQQCSYAPTPLLSVGVGRSRKWAVFDLSAAYGKPPSSVLRGGALIGRQVVIRDEMAAGPQAQAVWAMHTSAELVSLEERMVRFKRGDDELVVRILEPASARFALKDLPPPKCFERADVRMLHGLPAESGAATVAELPRRDDDEQGRATGSPIRRLEIDWPEGARQLVVLISPDADDDDLPPQIAPLAAWNRHGPCGPAPAATRTAPRGAMALPRPTGDLPLCA